MHKITPAWIDAQIEKELDRECCASAVYDLAALVTVRNYLHGMQHDGVMAPMRDNNVINIGDYQDKRRIGFEEDRMMNDEYEGNQHHKYGHSDYKHDKMDQHTAERWVDEMEGSDPANPMGGKWTPEQVKPYAQKYGFPTEGDKFWEFYAVMNAMYSDAFDTAKEFNLVKPEFFASLAKGWINDKDAVPNKAKVYYECVVR